MGEGVGGVDIRIDGLGRVVEADQRLHQAVRMGDIVEAEAALDAKAVLVRRAVASVDIEDLLVADVVGDLTADAAIGADAVDLPVGLGVSDARFVHHRCRHQGAGGAGLDAFAAGDTGALSHGIVEIENDLRCGTAPGHADHVVDLDLAAGADAEITVDAGIEMHRHGGMAEIGRRRRARRKAALRHLHASGPVPKHRIRVVGAIALRLIGEQQLHHHAPRGACPLRSAQDLHVRCRGADARRGEHALALDLDHAGAAVAVGAIARIGRIAEMGYLDPLALGDLPDGLSVPGLDLPTVEGEFYRAHHIRPPRAPNPRGNGSAPS